MQVAIFFAKQMVALVVEVKVANMVNLLAAKVALSGPLII